MKSDAGKVKVGMKDVAEMVRKITRTLMLYGLSAGTFQDEWEIEGERLSALRKRLEQHNRRWN